MIAKTVRTLKNYISWADEKRVELKYDKSLPNSTIGFVEPFVNDGINHYVEFVPISYNNKILENNMLVGVIELW